MHGLIVVSALIAGLIATGRQYPEAFPYVLAGAAALVLIGLFHRTVEQLIGALVQPVVQLDAGRAAILGQVNRVQRYVARIRRGKGLVEESVFHSRLAGTILHTVLSIGMAFSELYLIVGALRVLVPQEVTRPIPILSSLEGYLIWIIAGVLVAGSVQWGMYIRDAEGKSNLTPNHDLSEERRKPFLRQAYVALVGYGLLLVLLATYRGVALLPDEGVGVVEPVALESMNFDLDALVAAQDALEPSSMDATPYEQFGEAVMITVQVVLAALIFFTLSHADWVIDWLYLFIVIGLAKLGQVFLMLGYLLVSMIRAILRPVARFMVPLLDFIRRAGMLVASPLVSQLDSRYVDGPEELSVSARAAASKVEERASFSKDDAGLNTQPDRAQRDDQRERADTDVFGAVAGSDCDDEPVMIVSEEMEPEETEPETQNRNWSPYQS